MGATKRLTHFNNQPIIRATITLSHYNIKKRVEWYIGRKKYNIYYVYNYILPQSPLKNRRFSESMILVFGQHGE